MARKSREQTESVADIGELPEVEDRERRAACQKNLLLFLTTYFPNSTGLKPFSGDHVRVIERIQRCVLEGGRFVNAVYRGFAKTTISENSAIWATIYGHRKFVPIFGGDQASADANIDSIKRELEGNDLLLADFPEVCYAIRCLEGKPQRQHSQSYRGQLTKLRWTANTVVLPSIAGSIASGAILCAHGLTGASRGMKYKRPDGVQQRPDFVIIDDPQTDESAASPLQVSKRLKIIHKSILKAGGHNKSLAVVMNATVIEPDDLVDQLLDPKKHAAWQGERIKMVRRWADKHDSLWLKDYAELRTSYDTEDPQSQKLAHERATEFYRDNRAAMDAGAVVSWEHCYDDETEISAIQHAYNALIDDGPEVFASEFQNDPLPSTTAEGAVLSVDEIVRKINGYPRRVVPQDAIKATAFIDVQKDVLFWAVCGWADDFTGYVLDYGAHPDQGRDRFTLRDLRKTLGQRYSGAGFEGALFAGLTELVESLAEARWNRQDGSALTIERLLIDANWGDSTETIYKFCGQSKFPGLVMPSHGQFVRAASRGLNENKPKIGERRGLNWRIPPTSAGKVIRHVLFDANYWKSFVFRRLSTALGDPGSLTLFNASPNKHALIADHLTAETPAAVTAHGRTVEEWTLRPHKPDNHWFDCLVGCAVGAAIQGISLAVHRERSIRMRKRQRPRVTYF
jgi:hypothetical protein